MMMLVQIDGLQEEYLKKKVKIMRIIASKRNEWEYLYVDQVQEVVCYKDEDIEDESIY